MTEAGFEVRDWGGILRRLVGSRYIHLTAPQPLLRPLGSAIYFAALAAPSADQSVITVLPDGQAPTLGGVPVADAAPQHRGSKEHDDEPKYV